MTENKETTYELGYLLRDGAEKAPILVALDKIGATVVYDGDLKSIKLAYEIEKQTTGQFAYVHFQSADTQGIKLLNDDLRMQDSVLRFLIIKLPPKKEKSTKRESKREIEPEPEKIESLDNLSNEKLEEKLEELVN